MRIPAPVERFLSSKRAGAALLVFALGLLALPVAFIAGGIHYHFALSWRPSLDYFEWGAAAFGLTCCLIAPFLPKLPFVQKIFLSLVAVLLYVLDLCFSALASIFVFGFPN